MKKIAMLNCLNANDVCGGVGCMKAFHQRRATFERYADQDAEVYGFLRCSQCGVSYTEDPGMTEKLERLVSEGIEAVHIGVCAYKKSAGQVCPFMEQNAAWLTDHGIEVVWGTHSFVPGK